MKDKNMKILLVNDDGIDSPGIVHLAQMAMQLGEVWVAAPASQCSAMSQKLTIFNPLEVRERKFPLPVAGAYSIGGTPADCVKAALKNVLPLRPDIVFSGINIGYNTGFDIAYSGTVAAAMEAVMNGIPAIAFSAQHDGSYDVTDSYILDITRELLDAPLAPGEIWNVNFPGCALDEFKGILRERTIAPTFIFDNTYAMEKQSGGMTLTPGASFISHVNAPSGSDIEAVLHGYISIGKVKSMVL